MTGTEIALLNGETPESAIKRLKLQLDAALTDGVYLRKRVLDLESQVGREFHERQGDADKRRARETILIAEIRSLRNGRATGCGCPAGKCMKIQPSAEMCWAQWAGRKAIVDAAQRAIDSMIAETNHPRNYLK